MAGDWYPKPDGDKVTFLDNFVAVLATVGVSVGMTPGDQLAASGATNDLKAGIADKVAKKTAAQSSTAACKVTDAATEDTIRGLVRRIKAHAAYTVAIGEQLGIVAPEGQPTGDGVPDRPDLKAVSVKRNEVVIAFAKHGHTGVQIETRRGGETAYTFLARDTVSPYVDTRPNLTDGPESREYIAQFLDNDDIVGEVSDTLKVTVPGVSA